MDQDIDIYLRKIYLIIIILDLTRDYKDISIHIVKFFKKIYIKYN